MKTQVLLQPAHELIKFFARSVLAFAVLSAFLLLAACGQKNSSIQNLSNQVNAPDSFSDSQALKPFCNPLGSAPSPVRDFGLKGSLFTLKPGVAPFEHIEDAIAPNSNATPRSEKNPRPLFLGNLEIGPIQYNPSQVVEPESPLETQEGKLVADNFAIEVESQIGLKDAASADEEGMYELAVIVQDSVQVDLKHQGIFRRVLENDGRHSMQMVCSQHGIALKKRHDIPIRVRYLQGNRGATGLIMLWRKIRANEKAGQDPLCFKEGEGLFFKTGNGQAGSIKAAKGMNDLKLRNWVVLESENFKLPENVSNLCAAPPKVP